MAQLADDWADRWRPHVPSLPTEAEDLARIERDERANDLEVSACMVQ